LWLPWKSSPKMPDVIILILINYYLPS
jgi:hypothetical protein